mmetsp:Transcript_13273/g.33488  ORF Transcript_13273/g.33488 Transcript_13273/m.33488 type:complete len:355 (-) Transcript_13273:411-1475(-)
MAPLAPPVASSCWRYSRRSCTVRRRPSMQGTRDTRTTPRRLLWAWRQEASQPQRRRQWPYASTTPSSQRVAWNSIGGTQASEPTPCRRSSAAAAVRRSRVTRSSTACWSKRTSVRPPPHVAAIHFLSTCPMSLEDPTISLVTCPGSRLFPRKPRVPTLLTSDWVSAFVAKAGRTEGPPNPPPSLPAPPPQGHPSALHPPPALTPPSNPPAIATRGSRIVAFLLSLKGSLPSLTPDPVATPPPPSPPPPLSSPLWFSRSADRNAWATSSSASSTSLPPASAGPPARVRTSRRSEKWGRFFFLFLPRRSSRWRSMAARPSLSLAASQPPAAGASGPAPFTSTCSNRTSCCSRQSLR